MMKQSFQTSIFDNQPTAPALTLTPGGRKVQVNPNGHSIKGCSIIYAPRGQAGEYAKLSTNPYRGCGHECRYCLDGDTLIQMADGTTKPIRDINIGDAIIGIVNSGDGNRAWNNRFATTTVLAKVVSQKDAYKITLEGGNTVICSADHRWLTERGWKYTIGSMSGDNQRPYLTTNNGIRQLSNADLTPNETQDYKSGYLAGMISGDANLAIYDYSHKRRKSGKTMGIQYRFRLALKDKIAVDRTKQYLEDFNIEVNEFTFQHDGTPLPAISTTSPKRFEAISHLSNKRSGTTEWFRGWLAGIFDAEGSHGKQALRIHNIDEGILNTTKNALETHKFKFIHETNKGRTSSIRITGGRIETTRFWQVVGPCIARKFNLEGAALRGISKIISIEPLNETHQMFDIMTGTENFIANGLVSHNCYVPRVLRMKREEFDAGAIERPDFAKKLSKDARKYQAADITEQVMLSFTTDPYHPTDSSLTRETIQILQAHGLAVCTLTKGGSRALRDLDLFRSERDAFAATLTTLDNDFSQKWEAGAALPQDRIETLKKFHAAGIFTWVSLEPTLDCDSSIAIIEATHNFVDLYKIGRANYLPMTATTDWEVYTNRILETVNRLDVKHYIKKDLQKYLPEGYHNPKYISQYL